MDIKSLEYSTLKIPYENFNKKYRNSLKILDKEFNQMQYVINDTDKTMKDLNESPDSINKICNMIDNISEKLHILKRKAKESLNDEKEALKVCRTRVDHLKEGCITPSYLNNAPSIKQDHGNLNGSKGTSSLLPSCQDDHSQSNNGSFIDPNDSKLAPNSMPKGGTPIFENQMIEATSKLNLWKKKRLDRMLIEYFLRHGYYDTAKSLAEHANIQNLTNIDLFLLAKDIENSLLAQQTYPCLAWCYENKSKLKKIKSNIEFELRVQEFIQLFQKGLLIEAVKYSRKHFSAGLEDSNYIHVKKIMGLLAFNPADIIESYKEYLSVQRWVNLVHMLRDAIYKMYQLDQQSIFSISLQAGLASLKTPQCYNRCIDQKPANLQCPICNSRMSELAELLPFAHSTQSRLVCRISREPLDENNPPLMLPNGQIYGKKALIEMAIKNDSKITCPLTKETYTMGQIEKVYIM